MMPQILHKYCTNISLIMCYVFHIQILKLCCIVQTQSLVQIAINIVKTKVFYEHWKWTVMLAVLLV